MFSLFKFSFLRSELFVYLVRFGYAKSDLLKDLFSGLSVAIVALPLAMAIAIASNLPPERGLFTAVVAGAMISILGGSRYQIGGPTAAFIVTVAMVAMKHGYDGLVLATIMAGVLLLIASFLRAGELLKFIPYPVIVGFTSGIAFLIFFSQLRDFFGLNIKFMPPDFMEKLGVYAEHVSEINPYAVAIGVLSLLTIVLLGRSKTKIPAPIVVVTLSAVVVWFFDLPIETIESKFGDIPAMLPSPSWPDFTFDKMRLVLADAITIAILAGIESLLSAVVADGMSGTKHNPHAELFAQGVANITSGVFGGLPATGAIARTATNIKAGAITPFSGVFHALWLLLFMMLLAPFIAKIPLAALSAILIIVAYNMSEVAHIRLIMKAPRNDRVVLFVTLILTVLVDLNFAIQAGISLASILFINAMMNSIEIKSISEDDGGDDPDATANKIIPESVEVYELRGPLFFGVSEKLLETAFMFEPMPKVFILRLRYVPMIDAAGIHTLEMLNDRLKDRDAVLLLSGVNRSVKRYIDKSHLREQIGSENMFDHIDKALERANELLQ